ncbi:ssDNA-binding protein, partial [Xenorhabdus bovienii]|uniref:ssDNA-binding protein n=1 Tax=Xenorhabdus bovienii TaxID=40576 RepID=UPI003DA2F2B0
RASRTIAKGRPLVIDCDRTPLTAQDGRPYSGCYVNATISIFAYDKKGKGIGASLGGVQFLRDGDAFAGGGVASVDDFDDLSEGADAEAEV